MELLPSLLHRYGLLGICLMIFLEYACFPISSEIVLPFCGAFAKSCEISFFALIPASILSGLLGTTLCYVIGRLGGGRILNFLKTRFPKTKKLIHIFVYIIFCYFLIIPIIIY